MENPVPSLSKDGRALQPWFDRLTTGLVCVGRLRHPRPEPCRRTARTLQAVVRRGSPRGRRALDAEDDGRGGCEPATHTILVLSLSKDATKERSV